MPKTLNPQNAFPTSIPNFPISGNNEPIAIEPLENAIQAVLNRTENLHVRQSEAETQGVKRVRMVASLAALSAATGFNNGDVCDVEGYGRYRLYNPSGLAADGLWVLTAAGGGRWVHTLRDMRGIGNGLATLDSSQRLAQDVRDASILTQHIANQAVTSAKLAPGSVVGHLGYTPVNKTGDTMTGNLIVNASVGINRSNPDWRFVVEESAQPVAAAIRKINNGDNSGAWSGPALHVEQTYGNHSWGNVAEFRVNDNMSKDPPNITFTAGWASTGWAVGMAGNNDSDFAIVSNRGWRFNGFGTVQLRVKPDGTLIVNGRIDGRYDHQNRFVISAFAGQDITVNANNFTVLGRIFVTVPSGRSLYVRRVRAYFTGNFCARVVAITGNVWVAGQAALDADINQSILTGSASELVYVGADNVSGSNQTLPRGHGAMVELEIR
jgi:hypothetical protein